MDQARKTLTVFSRPVLPENPKVLIVEDDPGIRTLLIAALKREPLDLDIASDGVEALQFARKTKHAVILLDLMLPRLTGPEFLMAFREACPDADPIILVMTAFDDSQIMKLGPNAVHGVIRKPFDIQRLVEMVRDCARMKMSQLARKSGLPDSEAVRPAASDEVTEAGKPEEPSN